MWNAIAFLFSLKKEESARPYASGVRSATWIMVQSELENFQKTSSR
jgi:hypothetical protein